MKIFLLLAKTSIAFIWGSLIFNILMAPPGKLAIALYIMTGFLFMMHVLQLLIFIGAFGDKVKITGWEKCSIVIFGIFALLDIRRKYMM